VRNANLMRPGRGGSRPVNIRQYSVGWIRKKRKQNQIHTNRYISLQTYDTTRVV
jgi:hypothetical protein